MPGMAGGARRCPSPFCCTGDATDLAGEGRGFGALPAPFIRTWDGVEVGQYSNEMDKARSSSRFLTLYLRTPVL